MNICVELRYYLLKTNYCRSLSNIKAHALPFAIIKGNEVRVCSKIT
jgi:hypothetical protein